MKIAEECENHPNRLLLAKYKGRIGRLTRRFGIKIVVLPLMGILDMLDKSDTLQSPGIQCSYNKLVDCVVLK